MTESFTPYPEGVDFFGQGPVMVGDVSKTSSKAEQRLLPIVDTGHGEVLHLPTDDGITTIVPEALDSLKILMDAEKKVVGGQLWSEDGVEASLEWNGVLSLFKRVCGSFAHSWWGKMEAMNQDGRLDNALEGLISKHGPSYYPKSETIAVSSYCEQSPSEEILINQVTKILGTYQPVWIPEITALLTPDQREWMDQSWRPYMRGMIHSLIEQYRVDKGVAEPGILTIRELLISPETNHIISLFRLLKKPPQIAYRAPLDKHMDPYWSAVRFKEALGQEIPAGMTLDQQISKLLLTGLPLHEVFRGIEADFGGDLPELYNFLLDRQTDVIIKNGRSQITKTAFVGRLIEKYGQREGFWQIAENMMSLRILYLAQLESACLPGGPVRFKSLKALENAAQQIGGEGGDFTDSISLLPWEDDTRGRRGIRRDEVERLDGLVFVLPKNSSAGQNEELVQMKRQAEQYLREGNWFGGLETIDKMVALGVSIRLDELKTHHNTNKEHWKDPEEQMMSNAIILLQEVIGFRKAQMPWQKLDLRQLLRHDPILKAYMGSYLHEMAFYYPTNSKLNAVNQSSYSRQMSEMFPGNPNLYDVTYHGTMVLGNTLNQDDQQFGQYSMWVECMRNMNRRLYLEWFKNLSWEEQKAELARVRSLSDGDQEPEAVQIGIQALIPPAVSAGAVVR